jgi:hypothetical protein
VLISFQLIPCALLLTKEDGPLLAIHVFVIRIRQVLAFTHVTGQNGMAVFIERFYREVVVTLGYRFCPLLWDTYACSEPLIRK